MQNARFPLRSAKPCTRSFAFPMRIAHKAGRAWRVTRRRCLLRAEVHLLRDRGRIIKVNGLAVANEVVDDIN